MKNKFRKLRDKLLLQIIKQSLIIFIIWWLIKIIIVNGLIKESFINWFLNICQNQLYLDNTISIRIYQMLFQNLNYFYFIAGLLVLLFVIPIGIANQTAKYLNEINNGLDNLSILTEEELLLSPELEDIQTKLNKIKRTIKKHEYKTKNTEQRKNDLIIYLAHDMKTPLTSIIGYLGLINEVLDLPYKQKAKYINIIQEKAYYLEQLINELFEITRFNVQTMILNKEKLNLSLMLQQLADEFYPRLTTQGKEISIDAEEHLVLYGDADKLARVFNNILKNAIAYSFKNSKIMIFAKREKELITINFCNHGEPIPAKRLESIFEKFYRLETNRSDLTGGSGLGLAIAKEIVTAHQGSIMVASNIEQTIFTVKLPIDLEI